MKTAVPKAAAHLPVLDRAVLAALTFPAIAAPGDLDPTFGGTGIVITPFGSGFDEGQGMVVQSDGKIVVVGNSYNGTDHDFALIRYNPNGSLDTTFNSTGKVTTPVGPGSDYARSVAMQNDGKIVVAGGTSDSNSYGIALARYHPDGSLDTGFNGTGKVIALTGGNVSGQDVAIQLDGKIVVVGNGVSGFLVARFNPDGSLDTDFGCSGTVTTPISSGGGVANSVALQSDGRIVAAGYSNNGYNDDFALVRYNPDGSLDAGFNGTGKVITVFGNSSDIGESVKVQGDGKIVVAGYTSDGSKNFFALARYNADGTLDTSFNGTGKVTTAINASAVATSVALQSNGKLVVAGNSSNAGNTEIAVVRYNPDGSLDPAFHGSGKVTTDVGSGTEYGDNVAIQSDGKIVVAVRTIWGAPYDFGVVRYEGDTGAEIAVEQPTVVTVADGATKDFGSEMAGSAVSLTFTIKNIGIAALTGLGITIDGANAAEFSVTAIAAAPVPPGAATTFTIAFTPASTGAKTAALHIASNDADETPFDIALTGSGIGPGWPSAATEAATGVSFTAATLHGVINASGESTAVSFEYGLTNSYGTTVTGAPTSVTGSSPTAVSAALAGLTPFTTYHYRVTGTNNHGTTPGTDLTFTTRAAVPLASPGDLDPTFAVTGAITSAPGYLMSVAVQSDGKVLVAGTYTDAVNGVERKNLVRLNDDGTLDADFVSGVNDRVDAIAVQPDGRILVGGAFTAVTGTARPGLARLNADGTLDMGFNPSANAGTSAIGIQSNGKIVIAGPFTFIGGVVRNNLARLNADGTVDPGFNPDPNVNFPVSKMVVREDGKIIIAGRLSSPPNTNQPIRRLNADGTLDSGFYSYAGVGGTGRPTDIVYVNSISLQADGKIVLGGRFNDPGDNVARLNADGRPDTGFEPNPGHAGPNDVDNIVDATAVQADGKILIGGGFGAVGGKPAPGLARLNTDGTLDTGFNARGGGGALSIAIQADGKIVVGGRLRLEGSAAPQSLTIPNASRVQWLRGGASPEAQQVSFEVSTDHGAHWTALGMGTRIVGGWELTGLSLPAGSAVRGLALTGSAGASGVVEAVTEFGDSAPAINLTGNNVSIPDGDATPGLKDHTDFGNTLVGGNSVVRTFTVQNTGMVALTLSGTPAVEVSGPNAADFIVTEQPSSLVASLTGSTTFQIAFTPSAAGVRTAAVSIANNDSDENPYNFAVKGTGALPEIAVEQPAGAAISNGGSRNFGTVPTGSSASLNFTIKNSCCGNLTGLAVTKDGADAALFTVTANPCAPVTGPDGSTNFTVRFAPASTGMKTAVLHIASNDADDNPFNIILTGTGALPADIAVEQPPGTNLPDGGSRDFGSVLVGDDASLLFTLKNSGGVDLTGLNFIKDGADASMFSITTNNPGAPVSPNGATSFTVRFAPTGTGLRSAAMHITSNDPDENPFDIILTGTGVPRPEIVDPGFHPVLNDGSFVGAIAVQPDGKILLGGVFITIDGQPRNNIARLLADGTLESTATFNAGAGVQGTNGIVDCIAVQADGKILLGGQFTSINGQPRNNIARLNADGTLESAATFNPVGLARVRSLALQADGRIIIGGFRSFARLHANGTFDRQGIVSGATLNNSWVFSVIAQPDGKVLLGGDFWQVDGQSRNNIARLNGDGSLEASLNVSTLPIYCMALQPDRGILLGGEGVSLYPAATGDGTPFYSVGPGSLVLSMALQADGKILTGGTFTEIDLLPRSRIARFNADITPDRTFVPGSGANADVYSVALQADGKILLGGYFSAINGQPRNAIARLKNNSAAQNLTITGSARIQWERGGSAPELGQVTFDLSTNNGASWSPLGPGARISGGWELTGLSLPANAAIRARGRTTGGELNGSSGLVEQTFNIPEIAVLDSSGVDLINGTAATNFGPVVAGGTGSTTFTIRSAGTGDLTGLAVTLAAGGNPGDFAIGPLGAVTLAPGASTTFTVSFSPSPAGTRTATLQIASNDPDENPFKINLTGIQATPSEAWRQTYFGSPYNTGAGADLNDADGDGIVNLLEYATATDPLRSTAFPGKAVKNGSLLEFTYTRRKTAVAEMSFVREFSETLTGTWSAVAGTVETILSDDGVLQQVKTTVPAGSNGRRFVRLRVTRL